MVLRAWLLYLQRERDSKGSSRADTHSAHPVLAPNGGPSGVVLNLSMEAVVSADVCLDLRGGHVHVAEDYTKRKHVLRVTSRGERFQFLLQLENLEDLKSWLRDLSGAVAVAVDGPAAVS